jgi:hypothetical protein
LRSCGLRGDSRSVAAFCDDYVARMESRSGLPSGPADFPTPPPNGSVPHSELHREDRDEPAV